MLSTNIYSQRIAQLAAELSTADAVLIGAGSGLSTAAGLTYQGERFEHYFADFQQKYGITDMYSGGFYPYPTLEQYWAWWSRQIYLNRYDQLPGQPYLDLLSLVQHRDYFVLTTNVDHQFQLAGFDKNRLFYTQGDYGLWQCSKACHPTTYDNESTVRQMVLRQKNLRVPSELIPFCPVCGAPMTMNLRCDAYFVQDTGWYQAQQRFESFMRNSQQADVLYLELGVGNNTPAVIKYPFWRWTASNPHAVYACVNHGQAGCPPEIAAQAICFDQGICQVLSDLKGQG